MAIPALVTSLKRKFSRGEDKSSLSPCGKSCEECKYNIFCLGCEAESSIRKKKCPIRECFDKNGKICKECENLNSCEIYISVASTYPYRQYEGFRKGIPYLISEEDSDKSIKIFKKLITSSARGIYVTKELNGREGLENVYIIIFPEANLEKLYENISGFAEKNSVILLTDFHSIIESNSFHEVREFIEKLLELIVINDLYLIISLNKEVIDKVGEIISDFYTIYMIQGISNPIRKNILEFLKRKGKTNFSEILRNFNIKSAPNLSFHLKELKKNRLIAQDEENLYYITREGNYMLSLINELREKLLESIELRF